jgi:BMFP domain-containing protein YqiC
MRRVTIQGQSTLDMGHGDAIRYAAHDEGVKPPCAHDKNRASVSGMEAKMQGGNRLMDDFARMVTDAAGMAQGMRREVEGVVKSQFERFIRDMDLVTREEFEAVREMAILAREENEKLAARIAALEAAAQASDPA